MQADEAWLDLTLYTKLVIVYLREDPFVVSLDQCQVCMNRLHFDIDIFGLASIIGWQKNCSLPKCLSLFLKISFIFWALLQKDLSGVKKSLNFICSDVKIINRLQPLTLGAGTSTRTNRKSFLGPIQENNIFGTRLYIFALGSKNG